MTQCSCGTEWTGLVECHCPTCHKSFSSEANFDEHRTGDYDTGRRCYTTEELLAMTVGKALRPRFKQSPQKDGRMVWVTWSAGESWWDKGSND